MKKRNFIIFSFFVISLFLLSLVGKRIMQKESNSVSYSAGVASTKYYDYSQLLNLDPKYSYSSIFYSENTEFEVLTSDGNITWSNDVLANGEAAPTVSGLKDGQTYELLITNSGVNKNGEVLDVIIKVDNIHTWNETGSVYLATRRYLFLNSQNVPVAENGGFDYERKLEYGDLLLFELGATVADCDLTIEYYIAGTYNTTTHTGVPGGITSANSFYYDIDVSTTEWEEIFKGQEGFTPMVGESTIYYDKNHTLTTFGEGAQLQEIDNGIAIFDRTVNAATNGIWYATSAFMITDNMDSVFKFKYGGAGCGTSFAFVSPYPYDIPSPIKSIDSSKEEVTSNDSFYYEVMQFVPNNYYGTVINFNEIYSNLYENTQLKKLVIEDTISNYLTVNSSGIKIYNENDIDVTDDFTVGVSGQRVTATAKIESLSASNFYNHSYSMRIPVTVKNTGVNVKTIPNHARTTSSTDLARPDVTNDSNVVNINVYYNVLVEYRDEYDNHLLDSETMKKYPGDSYSTIQKSFEHYDFSRLGGDPVSGTVSDKDLKVVYYYKKQATVTVNHYLLNSSGGDQQLIQSGVQNKHYNDTYETTISNKVNYDYYYLRETPSNATGTVKKDNIVVDYYYVLRRGDVLVHHYIEDTTTKIANDETNSYEYGSRYETHESTDLFEPNYTLAKVDGDPAEGTVEKDKVEVIYYYKIRDSVLDTTLRKTAEDEMNDYTKPITYEIEYNISISDYEGDATIKIVDKLPYKIDLDHSNVGDGTYDADTNTITWEERWENIVAVSAETPANKIVKKEITVLYIGIDAHTKDIYNQVIGTTVLSTIDKEDETETYENTEVKIPSKIIIHYYEEGTTIKLHDDTIINGYVDETVTSKALDINGYVLTNKEKENKHVLEEKETEFIYYYAKQKINKNPETSKYSYKFVIYLLVLFVIVIGIYNIVIKKKLYKI